MAYRVIVLNGASSSGKSAIARALQATLPEPWLTFSIDDLVAAMPAAMVSGEDPGGFTVGSDQVVRVGAAFTRLNVAWEHGVAAIARAGAPVIVDDVMLSGGAGQDRWRVALGDLPVLWVGVHCEPAELARREVARGDRVLGTAATQATAVHAGVAYDVEVDTTATSPADCASVIADRLRAG